MSDTSNRPYSSIINDGKDRAPNRSMLRAVGFQDEDFQKPVVGVASTWSMVTPCNMHIDGLAKKSEQIKGRDTPRSPTQGNQSARRASL